MSKLRTEYTDIKNVKHRVEHVIVTDGNNKSKEQLLEELFIALTKNTNFRITAE